MSADYQITVEHPSLQKLLIHILGKLSVKNATAALNHLTFLIDEHKPQQIDVELSNVSYFDSAGAAVLIELGICCEKNNCKIEFVGMQSEIKGLLGLLDFYALSHPHMVTHKTNPGFIIRMGDATYKFFADMKWMIVFLGDFTIAVFYAITHPKSIRWREVFYYLEKTGVDALPIVILIQFLIGVTMAFLGASQLKQFGANIYVADLVSLAMVLGVGPIMTAVIVAGRSGSAFAAEIGTMKVSEELDAMTALGLDHQRFIVLPKVIAVVIAMPCLMIISDIFGILGGAVIAVTSLDLTLTTYLDQTIKSLELYIIIRGLVNTVCFAILLSAVGCMRGFEAKGGPESVGECTTSAVVSAIFLIVIANAVMTVIYYGGSGLSSLM